MRSRTIVAVALLLLPLGALARRVHESSVEFYFSGAAGAGRSIEIKGIIGDVVAEPSRNGRVEVVAFKRSDHGDLRGVRVEVVQHEGGTTVCALYPNATAPSECAPGDEAQSGSSGSGVEVSFLVRVPAGVRFIGRTTNGKVATSRLLGPVEAHTVNGNIDIQTSGEARAHTVNGSITALLHSYAAAASLETINGNVTVHVLRHAAAQLDAQTVNGAIRAAVPICRTADSFNHFIGVLGRGGSRLDLRTVNGDIFLEPLNR